MEPKGRTKAQNAGNYGHIHLLYMVLFNTLICLETISALLLFRLPSPWLYKYDGEFQEKKNVGEMHDCNSEWSNHLPCPCLLPYLCMTLMSEAFNNLNNNDSNNKFIE